jgi:AcrR family transcriptional regulator
MLVTNILDVATKTEQTRERIESAAIALFLEQGFDETTVAQIASAAGVSEMTFFRYFPSKESVVLDDPYDPMLAAAVAERPLTESPLTRVAEGIRGAWRRVPEPLDSRTRERIRIASSTSSLQGSMWSNNAVTEAVIADQLIADGVDEFRARVAASACLGALIAALLHWARTDDGSLGDHIERALDVVVAR